MTTEQDRTNRLTALYRLCLREVGRRLELTEAEARCILDACNGLHLHDDVLGQHLRAEVSGAIALNALDQKWSVDGRALVRKLRDLPRGLTAAVEMWTDEFWATPDRDAEWEREHLSLLAGDAAGSTR